MVLLTIRNLGGLSLFLFGTTFLWLTPAFAGPGVPTGGVLWALARVLAWTTILGFTAAYACPLPEPVGGLAAAGRSHRIGGPS